MLDVHVHQLLLYAIFGSAAVAFLEVFHRGNILMEMLRCTLTMLQGSWFWQVYPKKRTSEWEIRECCVTTPFVSAHWLQIGFVLYPPHGAEWDLKDHNNVMFITMCYSWHLASALLVVSVLYSTVSW